MTIPIDVLFFIIPLLVLFFFAQRHSTASGYMGSDRSWFYMFMGPPTLALSFAAWAIYLKWFAP